MDEQSLEACTTARPMKIFFKLQAFVGTNLISNRFCKTGCTNVDRYGKHLTFTKYCNNLNKLYNNYYVEIIMLKLTH